MGMISGPVDRSAAGIVARSGSSGTPPTLSRPDTSTGRFRRHFLRTDGADRVNGFPDTEVGIGTGKVAESGRTVVTTRFSPSGRES